MTTFSFGHAFAELTLTDPLTPELGAPAAVLASGERFRFTVRESDAVAGLEYNRARYYDPARGRWLSEDLPLGPADAELHRAPPPEPPDR